MARVKLTEYRAKKIILGDSYGGISLPEGKLPKSGRWVAKVDQGVKKRLKQGLVAVDVSPAQAVRAVGKWKKKGFSQFLLEPFVPHKPSEEQYLSLERVREGIRVLHARGGGIDIEAHPEAVKTYLIREQKDIAPIAAKMQTPSEFLERLYETFDKYFFAFLEINPLVVRGKNSFLLDAAALVDGAGAFFVREGWSEADIVKAKAKHKTEEAVEKIAATTAASLKLSVLNPNGSLFFLLSGGGGSIVIADEAQLKGMGASIGNYGEYSGGPTREETYLYAKEVIRLLLHSREKKKALVIAGGVANFTDVRSTFLGIIDALSEVADALRRQKIQIFVRRGGPNEAAGLNLMHKFLSREKLLGAVHGSDAVITKAVDDAIEFVRV